jgi:orotate phosphoribosyltransferase
MRSSEVLDLVSARKGHFLLESGHHGDLWLDLEMLCLRPRSVQNLAAELVPPLSKLDVEAVCGPLVEGAFVGLMVALQLDVQFTYSERHASSAEGGLFPVAYRIPAPLRAGLRGKRVAIVNDVINAGSAVKGTFADLQSCGAVVVCIGALLVLGDAASTFAAGRGVPLQSIAALPNNLWSPTECPLCASGTPLEIIPAVDQKARRHAASDRPLSDVGHFAE